MTISLITIRPIAALFTRGRCTRSLKTGAVERENVYAHIHMSRHYSKPVVKHVCAVVILDAMRAYTVRGKLLL